MHYPLPVEEDVTSIRTAIHAALIAELVPQIRERVLYEYIQGMLPADADLKQEQADRFERQATQIVKRATMQSWYSIRQDVYTRDNGICHVCGDVTPRRHYECGHIIDRVCGGSDRPSNLVTMCIACNRHKPCHTSRAEYIAWLDAGDWRDGVIARLLERLA